MLRIPASVVERLGHYVYVYVHRGTGEIQYVGKGRGQRALAHLMRLGQHHVDIIAHGLPDEAAAFAVERALIDALGLTRLSNKVLGHRARVLGREPLEDLIFRYAARPITISEPAILIRINRLYRPGMKPRELYEATRGVWVIGERRGTLKYALAVYHGIVREVYAIKRWHRAGTTWYRYRGRKEVTDPDRWEFVGSVANSAVRRKYVGGSVEHLLPDGAQNPIKYVP